MLAVLALAGCESPTSGSQPSGSSTSSPAGSVTTSATAASAPRPAVVWKGKTQAKKAEVQPPKGVTDRVWAQDDGQAASGDVTIELEVDSNGDVKGSAKGALGDLVIRGALSETTLRAAVTPKDPEAPIAMTGVLTGTVSDAAIEATLRASNLDGSLARQAVVRLER